MVYTYIETNPQRKEDCTLKTLLIDLPTVLPVAVTKPRIQPPLWAAYLASYLATDTILDYLDARSENDACWGIREEWKVWGIPLEQLVQEITTRQPDVVGIHVGVSTEIGLADQLVHEMRLLERFTPRILLGGPGVALVPDEFLPNHLRGAEICRTVGFGKPLHCNLFVPLPSIDVVPERKVWWDRYEETYQRNGNFHSGPPVLSPSLQIETSIGCGATCEFCATRGSLRRRTLQSVEAELQALRDLGVKGVHFEDDNILAWNDQQVLEGISYLELAVNTGFEAIEFPNGLTVRGMLNPHFLDWCAKTLSRGVRVKLALPFECASDRVLSAVFKPHRREHCNSLVEKIQPLLYNGLVAEVFLQIGFHIAHKDGTKDGTLEMEGENTITETLQWARELDQQGLQVNCWFNSPIPGTPLFAPWRQAFPNASWEELLFSIPSRFYHDEYRKELKQRTQEVNTARRAAAFHPAASSSHE